MAGLILKIVSGGQTGVDRAALDWALGLGLASGGWCPRGRRAEDGPIPDGYPLKETREADYAVRTRLNVRDSDATLILTRGRPSGGTQLTRHLAEELARPVLVVDFEDGDMAAAASRVGDWIGEEGVKVLNVAGPRESTSPGIYREASEFLAALSRQALNR